MSEIRIRKSFWEGKRRLAPCPDGLISNIKLLGKMGSESFRKNRNRLGLLGTTVYWVKLFRVTKEQSVLTSELTAFLRIAFNQRSSLDAHLNCDDPGLPIMQNHQKCFSRMPQMICLGNFLNWICACHEIRTQGNQICWEDDSLEFLFSKTFHNPSREFFSFFFPS